MVLAYYICGMRTVKDLLWCYALTTSVIGLCFFNDEFIRGLSSCSCLLFIVIYLSIKIKE